MIENEDFYGQCQKEEGIDVTPDVRAVAGNCFENRRCNEPDGLGTSLDQSKQLFVGFRPNGECRGNCTNDDIGLVQDLRSLASQRYKRQQIPGSLPILPPNLVQISTEAEHLLKPMTGQLRVSFNSASRTSSSNREATRMSSNNRIKRDDSNICAKDASTQQSLLKRVC